MSQSPKPMDFDRLGLVAETDEDKTSIMTLFFRMAENLASTMEGALQGGRLPQWKSAAHNLQGAAANLGMQTLRELCRNAENAEMNNDQRGQLLIKIKDEIQRVKTYFTAHHAAS